MKFDSIPLPQFSFVDEPERLAEKLYDNYLSEDYKLGYLPSNPFEVVEKVLWELVNKDDRIVFLSYLINKVTIRILALPQAEGTAYHNTINDKVRPELKRFLHQLYRRIQADDIDIPSDLFSEDDYKKAKLILLNIDKVIEQLKSENPTKELELTIVQDEVKKTTKFLWLGKDKWTEIVIGTIFKYGLEKSILPLVFVLFEKLKDNFVNLLNG